MKNYIRGLGTCHLTAEIRTTAGVLVDPTSVACTVYDPLKATVVSAQAATGTGGIYYYNYTPASDAALGKYSFIFRATDGTVYSTNDPDDESSQFLLVALP